MIHYEAAETTVVLLAAGHGKRMMPLTATVPKPLLKVGSMTLIEHHLTNLQVQGFRKVVINLAYLGAQIRDHLGDGKRFGVRISYSDESGSGALETAGGLLHALPLIDSDPFVVVNADIWTDYPYARLLHKLELPARLVMVKNPSHHQCGDFCFADGSNLLLQADISSPSYTFSGIALYQKSLFQNMTAGFRALAPVFQQLIYQAQLEGEIYLGQWQDIGTPERLRQLNSESL